MILNRPQDVKPKHFSGGEWKRRAFEAIGRHRHTASGLGRSYIAIPPEEGWPGGDPLRNGYKPTGGKK